jgi:uroporphyrin-III C-methyltransferase
VRAIASPPVRALVLAAHGSRQEPEANAAVRRLAESLRSRRLFDEVAVAFHQGEPGFDAVLDELSADEITVVPLLTSEGYYCDEVLPAALARNRRFGEVRLRQTPPVGTHAGIAPLVARRVTEVLRESVAPREGFSLLLVGHGTSRHAGSRTSTLRLAETLRRRRVAGEVLVGFLDDEPSVEAAVAQAVHPRLVVIPFLIGGGTHTLEDLPELLGGARQPSVAIDRAVGTYPGLEEIVVDLARRHSPPPAPRFSPRLGLANRKRGSVHLVGGGPGDPGLITARGLDLLRAAEVVVYDRLVGAEILGEARAGAELIDVGKGPGHAPYSQEEINAILVDRARRGRLVVRLKGGDPFVFGRGSEEVGACREARVPVHVVPGVSSALAGPAAAGIPLTARGLSRSFAVVTAQSTDGGTDLTPLAAAETLVVLMGRAALAAIAGQLVAAGRDPDTPAACIQSATTADQRVTRATLATIAEAADRDGLRSPVVTVIGEVAALANAGLSAMPAAALAVAAGA